MRITRKEISAALVAAGLCTEDDLITVERERSCGGYFYFSGNRTAEWYSTIASSSTRLGALSIEEWIREAVYHSCGVQRHECDFEEYRRLADEAVQRYREKLPKGA